ncbi:hypothetical protein AB0912_28670 [Streptomyces sp. NPDC007084]|uniref:hypothetical protein n=1 Tax=Streptomyces sp. NPDC007084 TaxID=3154313 RepID=UPI003456A473
MEHSPRFSSHILDTYRRRVENDLLFLRSERLRLQQAGRPPATTPEAMREIAALWQAESALRKIRTLLSEASGRR